jgi:hypothetical protein
MKANKNILPTSFPLVALLLLVVFQSCGTYNTKTSDIESNLFSGDFNQACASIDQNKFLLKERNRLLYLMEKGKIEHLRGNYDASNVLFEEAYIMIDDRIKTNVGQAVAAKFTNPMAEPYKGEDFEKVSIHYYKALNYFHLGMPNEALVEAKRINIKLYELNEKYSENKNKYSEDAFSQILQGILYESTGDINNAFIAYRNAEEIFARNNNQFFGVPLPEQLKKDLVRTTKQLGFREEHDQYRKKFGIAPDPVAAKPAPAKKGKGKGKKTAPAPPPAPKEPEVTGEAIVFWENGLGPAKDQIVITASGGSGVFYGTYMDGDIQEEILIPIPPGAGIGSINAIAIPKYRKRDSYYSKAAVMINDKEQPFELAQDFYPIAKQCLKDRMLRETIDIVARFATKKAASAGAKAIGNQLFGSLGGELAGLGADAAGAATEKADTRNWQTLPATIGYTRVPLKEGDNKFVIKKYGPQGIDTDTLTIPYKRGLQIVNYFDLGRTQVIPATETPQYKLNAVDGMISDSKTQGGTRQEMAASLMGSVAATQNLQKPSFAPAPPDVTPESVIQNYIAAVGGEDKIRSIQTMYWKSESTSVMDGKQTSTEMISKSNVNNDTYSQIINEGKVTMTTVVNDTGFYYFDADGKKNKMDKRTFKTMKEMPNLYQSYSAPLFGKNYKVEGITKINNEDTYAISFTEKTAGVDMIYYYSVKTGLLTATEGTVKSGGVNYTTKNYLSDYKDVNGILHPFKTKSTSQNFTSETITKEIKFNEGVFDTDFQVN